jgi:NADH:ubiquinone oxidoreductase subunit C
MAYFPLINASTLLSYQNFVCVINTSILKVITNIHKISNSFYIDHTAIDNVPLLQNIYMLRNNLHLITIITKSEIVPSIQSVYNASQTTEREVYEMFGVIFTGAFDLRRLLCDYSFQGFPLKKSFPLYGTDMIIYLLNAITHVKLSLSQMFRNFNSLLYMNMGTVEEVQRAIHYFMSNPDMWFYAATMAFILTFFGEGKELPIFIRGFIHCVFIFNVLYFFFATY